MACKRFSSCFDKNLWQAIKIFFGCRNGEIILIPTYDSAPAYHCKLGNKEGEKWREEPQQQPLRVMPTRDGLPRKGQMGEGGRSRMMRPGGGARAVALASDDVRWREEPRQTLALPPRQNKISRQFRQQENWIVYNPRRAIAMWEQSISSSLCASKSAILIGRRGRNGLLDAMHVRPAPPTQQRPANADRRVRLEDIMRYVLSRGPTGRRWMGEGGGGTDYETQGGVRRTQIWGRGGVGRQWGSPMLGVVRRNSLLERGGGARGAEV